jgi:hypothetical protein
MAIFAGARLLGQAVFHWPLVEWLRPQIAQALPIQFSGSIVLAFLLAELIAAVKNESELPEEVVGRVVGDLTDQLQRLLVTSARQGRPVMLTMSDRKVYVGLVLEAPSVEHRKAFVRVLPTFSGYRDDRHLVEVTTSYAWVHEPRGPHTTGIAGSGLRPEEFSVLLPPDGVVSARRFDSKAFEQFRKSPSSP